MVDKYLNEHFGPPRFSLFTNLSHMSGALGQDPRIQELDNSSKPVDGATKCAQTLDETISKSLSTSTNPHGTPRSLKHWELNQTKSTTSPVNPSSTPSTPGTTAVKRKQWEKAANLTVTVARPNRMVKNPYILDEAEEEDLQPYEISSESDEGSETYWKRAKKKYSKPSSGTQVDSDISDNSQNDLQTVLKSGPNEPLSASGDEEVRPSYSIFIGMQNCGCHGRYYRDPFTCNCGAIRIVNYSHDCFN